MPRIHVPQAAPFDSTGRHAEPSSSLGLLSQIAAALAARVVTPMSPRELYLSQATDHDDLLRRTRDWDAHEARQRTLPIVL